MNAEKCQAMSDLMGEGASWMKDEEIVRKVTSLSIYFKWHQHDNKQEIIDRVIELHKQKMHNKLIANEVDRSLSTVQNIVAKYKKEMRRK